MLLSTFFADASGASGGGRPRADALRLVENQTRWAGVQLGLAVDARDEHVARFLILFVKNTQKVSQKIPQPLNKPDVFKVSRSTVPPFLGLLTSDIALRW